MMDFPLTLDVIFRRAGALYANVEIVSRMPDKSVTRITYARLRSAHAQARVGALALGLKQGRSRRDAHVEPQRAPRGVLRRSRSRAACCTRSTCASTRTRSRYIATHAEDRFVIVDDVLLPLFDEVPHAKRFEKVIVVPLDGASPSRAAHSTTRSCSRSATANPKLPAARRRTTRAACVTRPARRASRRASSTRIARRACTRSAPRSPTRSASRATTRCFRSCRCSTPTRGACRTCARWSAQAGLSGAAPRRRSLLDLFEREQVTLAAGVPTIWLGILDALEKNPGRWKLRAGSAWSSAARRRPKR